MNNIQSIEKHIIELIKEFETKQGLEFEYFVGGECLGVASFGCVFFFNVQDIFYDMNTKQEAGKIIDWLYHCLDNPKKMINYRTYCFAK